MPSTTNAWAAVDDAVLRAFRDGQPRTARDVYRILPDLTHREVCHALDANAQHGHLATGESTYQITEAGQRHLASTMEVA